MMTGTIVLIGGGEIVNRGSAEIDRYVMSLAGKRPTVAFIPAASNDDTEYVRSFTTYCKSIGGGDILPILLSKESAQSVRKKIQQSQIVYLGMGEPKNLINAIKKKGFADELMDALEEGKIIAGISGGAVSVCKDCLVTKEPKRTKTSIMQGIGLTQVCAETNYTGQNDKALAALSKKLGRVYAIPQGNGIAIRGGNITMIGDSAKIAIFEKGAKITALTSLKRPF